MLDSILKALEEYEPTISSIVGLLTLCAAIWGVLQLTLSKPGKKKIEGTPRTFNQIPPSKRLHWHSLLNLGLNEHSQLEELVSVRTVNVVLSCLLALSLPWLLISLFSFKNTSLTIINLSVFVSALVGFTLQRVGASFAARWLVIVVVAVYWLGAMLTVGSHHGTEYFLAGILALPVLILSRVQTGQLIVSIVFLLAVFCLGVALTYNAPSLGVLSDTGITVGYYVNALFLAAIIFASVSYYKGFASTSYELLASKKNQNDVLVSKLFPATIAQQMMNQETVNAQWHPEVTVLFGRLTGFGDLYKRMPAVELITKLDELYSRFDELLENHHADKVKTLGTSYVAATGLDDNHRNYAGIASVALAMQTIVEGFSREHELKIGFRCGIATGLTISGVIGKTRPRFDIWGEALDAAAALQASAKDGEIQVNETAYWRLKDHFTLLDEQGNGENFILLSRPETDELPS